MTSTVVKVTENIDKNWRYRTVEWQWESGRKMP